MITDWQHAHEDELLLVDLSREFSHFSSQAKTLARRLSPGGLPTRPSTGRTHGFGDSRGPLVRSIVMAQTLLDAAEVDELVAMYVAGTTMREIAEHFRVRRTTVAIHLRRRSVPMRRGKLTAAQVTEIGGLYERGFTLAEIGMRFSVGQDTVRIGRLLRVVPGSSQSGPQGGVPAMRTCRKLPI